MSYATVNTCHDDLAFRGRINAAVAREQVARDEPLTVFYVAEPLYWAVAATSDIEAAYASALAAENPNPGGDESVITDGMILAAVQANWPAPATP